MCWGFFPASKSWEFKSATQKFLKPLQDDCAFYQGISVKTCFAFDARKKSEKCLQQVALLGLNKTLKTPYTSIFKNA
jgi:hypothetical protein